VPAFYTRPLRLLARRGLKPAAGETARELARRAPAAGAGALAALTAAYERVRFGGAVLTPTETAEVDAALKDLAVALRTVRPQ
jgi:hypothetical protein